MSLRLVRLRPARSRPVRPNPHDAIAHVCIVRARAMRVGCVRLRPARWGVVFVQGFAYVHLVVALVALFDDIVRLGVDASTWLIANYIMCGIGDGA